MQDFLDDDADSNGEQADCDDGDRITAIAVIRIAVRDDQSCIMAFCLYGTQVAEMPMPHILQQ